MKEKIPDEVYFNRRVNYIIIEKLWKHMNKDKDKSEFYDLLGLNKNVYCRIRNADQYSTVDLEKRWETKNSKLRQLGLSKEIMTGQEMIEVDGVTKEDWKDYIENRYENKDIDKDKNKDKNRYERTGQMQDVNKKLKKAFARLQADKKDKRDIAKLYYYFYYGRAVTLDVQDSEMIDFKDSLKHVSIENMKLCDKALRQEVYDILKEKFSQLDTIIKYENLK